MIDHPAVEKELKNIYNSISCLVFVVCIGMLVLVGILAILFGRLK